MSQCIRCKGRNPRMFCGREFCPIYSRFKLFRPEKIGLNFGGSSPPDIFVGRFQYPNVYTGILAPTEHSTEAYKLSSPEMWFKEKLSINDILAKRGSLIYSRFQTKVKGQSGKLLDVTQEISMAQKPCDMEFYLKKKPIVKLELDSRTSPLGNIAPLKKAKITENPKIPKKVDYVVGDNGLKAENAIFNLYKDNYTVTSMIKLLSAGLLGLKYQRKLVPSRWGTTAVDDIVSKNLMKKIKTYPWINDFLVFSDEYVGNHYEILLMPRHWSFEVIEAKGPGSVWNPEGFKPYFMVDYESVYKRKGYAANVTGAYYANRVACCEYLDRIKRQASILVLREVKPSYFAPLGVGILREVTRNAFKKKPRKFNKLNEAFEDMGSRIRLSIKEFVSRSNLLKEYREQSNLREFM